MTVESGEQAQRGYAKDSLSVDVCCSLISSVVGLDPKLAVKTVGPRKRCNTRRHLKVHCMVIGAGKKGTRNDSMNPCTFYYPLFANFNCSTFCQ